MKKMVKRKLGKESIFDNLLMPAERVVPGWKSQKENSTRIHELFDETHEFFLVVDMFNHVAHDDYIECAIGGSSIINIVCNEGEIWSITQELRSKVDAGSRNVYTGNGATHFNKGKQISSCSTSYFKNPCIRGYFFHLLYVGNNEFAGRNGLLFEISFQVGVPILHSAKICEE